MPISLKMPALSPTMEEGTLAKWLVKEGDKIEPGDIVAEIETDKATMEFECIEEGTLAKILVAEGTEGVKVGANIAMLAEEGEDPADIDMPEQKSDESGTPDKKEDAASSDKQKPAAASDKPADPEASDKGYGTREQVATSQTSGNGDAAAASNDDRIKASPLAKRIAREKGVDLASLSGSGPHGRIIKADVEDAPTGRAEADKTAPQKPVAMADETRAILDERVPHDVEQLSGMRKTIAKRLASSMQEAPHIYLTTDIRLDRLLEVRKELNKALTGRGVKLSVNDMLIKALGLALMDVPECNVSFAGKELIRYSRADISVAVSIQGGLITPIITDASGKSLSEISKSMLDLGQRAKKGKLQPSEYQGGTASLSNMGMMGIKQFTAVINPPQAAILAIGAGEERAIVENGEIKIANVMTATGSFDHRAVDGADGARLMAAFKQHCENPLGMLA